MLFWFLLSLMTNGTDHLLRSWVIFDIMSAQFHCYYFQIFILSPCYTNYLNLFIVFYVLYNLNILFHLKGCLNNFFLFLVSLFITFLFLIMLCVSHIRMKHFLTEICKYLSLSFLQQVLCFRPFSVWDSLRGEMNTCLFIPHRKPTRD